MEPYSNGSVLQSPYSARRQVPIQEAVHILDNQELVICSDRITYLSLAQGQALWSETDRSKQKDLITVYGTKIKNTTPYHWNSTSIVFLLTQLSRSIERTKKQTAIATIITNPNKNWKNLKREKYMVPKSYFQNNY